jgi:transcriptional regulator with XRE-family HTH domain
VATRTEFGEFLRARRERVTPAEAGLPAGGRRRTPGLRREELAMLAGISVDYLVRLEQGRETSPSTSVVRALADALGLGHDELVHMYGLVARHEKPEMCPNLTAVPVVADETRALLDRLPGTPAFVIDAITTVLAWNDAYDTLMRPTGLLEAEAPNLTRFTFRDERARTLYRDWESIAREQVGNLRTHGGDAGEELPSQALVSELTTSSPEFVRFWSEYAVGEKRTGVKALAHPTVGDLDLAFTALGLPEPGKLRMVTYLPADEESAVKLDRLLAPPRTGRPLLRVVDA